MKIEGWFLHCWRGICAEREREREKGKAGMLLCCSSIKLKGKKKFNSVDGGEQEESELMNEAVRWRFCSPISYYITSAATGETNLESRIKLLGEMVRSHNERRRR